MLQRHATHSAWQRAPTHVWQAALRFAADGSRAGERELADQAEAMVGQRLEQLAYHS